VWYLTTTPRRSIPHLIKHQAMRIYLGSGGIAPLILNLDTRWEWVVTFTPRVIGPDTQLQWHWSDRLGAAVTPVSRDLPQRLRLHRHATLALIRQRLEAAVLLVCRGLTQPLVWALLAPVALIGQRQGSAGPLYHRDKSARYILDRRLGGPQSWPWRCGEEKNSCPCRESNPGLPDRSLVTTLTEISRLYVFCYVYEVCAVSANGFGQQPLRDKPIRSPK
jgi:hypothetical protein